MARQKAPAQETHAIKIKAKKHYANAKYAKFDNSIKTL